MIITAHMLAAAFHFRSTSLWEILTDSDVFAFRLSDGETGYCSVMGNAGEHLALGFYKGAKGFSTYLKSLTIGNMGSVDNEELETIMTLDCINCDFMPAANINAKVKKVIREYANTHGLKISRSNGWPDFTRHQPYMMPYGITHEEDARDITEALCAAIAVAEEVANQEFETLGFDVEGNYPTVKGGKSVPYLIPNGDGTYQWSTTKLPALVKVKHAAPKFSNDILINKLKALPVAGTLQLRFGHIPAPTMGNSTDEVPYFPSLILCTEPETGYIFPIASMENLEKNPVSALVELANTFCRNAYKPRRIQVEDDKTEFLLKDFCHQCGIVLSRERTLPALNEAWNALLENFLS